MSSNRLIVLLVGAGMMAGCVVQNPTPNAALRTSTQQFAPKVHTDPYGILLRAGAPELSVNQQAAVSGLVRDWRDAGSGGILIEAPRSGGAGARHTAERVSAALQSLGVRGAQVSTGEYDAAADAPVRVSFLRHQVEPMACGQMMSDYTATAANRPFSNFGCATNANIAAMVANPADLVTSRAEAPIDAGRRQVVIDKYRAGEATASARDEQADGAISRVVD